MAAETDPVRSPGLNSILKETEQVDEQMKQYSRYFQANDTETTKKRVGDATELSSKFHTLVTDFYEYGWGESFHFCPLFRGRSFEECMAICEKYVGEKVQAGPGKKLADLGCGVGGPARRIGEAFGCEVVGLNICDYQLQKARAYTERDGLDKVTFMKGDFHNLPLKDNSFDGVYDFEAICHSQSLEKVYSEAFRILKPGGLYVLGDWFMTEKYNPNDPKQQKIKLGIQEGNGIANLHAITTALQALKKAGFEIIECADRAEEGDEPWYSTMVGRNLCSLQTFRASWIGRMVTHTIVMAMEGMGLSPRGSVSVHNMLLRAADSLVEGGKLGIFTPLYTVVAKKPLAAED